MISSDSCSKLVAGNYDILVSEPSPHSTQALKDFLDRFQAHQSELEAALEQSVAGKQGPHITFSYAHEFKLLKEFSTSLKEDKINLLEGKSECNSKKNRYKDIIPFSHTRVILNSNPPASQQPPPKHLDTSQPPLGLDYINANYVRGPSGAPRAYIAAQGPLPSTVCDFWRMVWECGVSVIVMACNEYESGELKCAPYYPEQIGHSIIYGNLKVTLARVRQICPDFLIRKLTVSLLVDQTSTTTTTTTCNGNPPKEDTHPLINLSSDSEHSEQNNNHTTYATKSNSNLTYQDKPSHVSSMIRVRQPPPRNALLERTICQFHYTTWPDHGVPNSVEPILELVRLMRDVQPSENKPILVHCSAGCGRTGTICCIDYVWGLLRRNKLNSNFNLWSIIRDMRQQRMSMVQTLEQYILCHKAVATLFVNHLNLIDSSLYNEEILARIKDRDTYDEETTDHDNKGDDETDREDEQDDAEVEDEEKEDSSKSFNEHLMGPVLI